MKNHEVFVKIIFFIQLISLFISMVPLHFWQIKLEVILSELYQKSHSEIYDMYILMVPRMRLKQRLGCHNINALCFFLLATTTTTPSTTTESLYAAAQRSKFFFIFVQDRQRMYIQTSHVLKTSNNWCVIIKMEILKFKKIL